MAVCALLHKRDREEVVINENLVWENLGWKKFAVSKDYKVPLIV